MIEQAECIVCEKEYPRRIGRGKGRVGMKTKCRRGKNTITCSHKCSRIYDSVYNKIRQNYFLKEKNGKKILG